MEDLIASPPFRVTLSASMHYPTLEPVDYAPAETESVHTAEAFGSEAAGGS